MSVATDTDWEQKLYHAFLLDLEEEAQGYTDEVEQAIRDVTSEDVLAEVNRILEVNKHHDPHTGKFSSTGGSAFSPPTGSGKVSATVGVVSSLISNHPHKVSSLPHGGVKVVHTGPAHEKASANAAVKSHLEGLGGVVKEHSSGDLHVSHFKSPTSEHTSAPMPKAKAAKPTAPKTVHVEATRENVTSLLQSQGHDVQTSWDAWKQSSNGFYAQPHTSGSGVYVRHVTGDVAKTAAVKSDLEKAGVKVEHYATGLHVTHVQGAAPPPSPKATKGKLVKGELSPASGDHDMARTQVEKALQDHHVTSQDYKIAIQNDLSKRLEGNAVFQSFAERHYPSSGAARPDAVRQLISTWASTSGDSNPRAILMQRAVREEFGLAKSTVTHLKPSGHSEHDMTTMYAEDGPALRHFARAMYDHTQAHLAAQGITEMTLYRGIHGKSSPSDAGKLTTAMVRSQPASSWAYDMNTAKSFALGGQRPSVLAARIPRERILGTMKTGFGCKEENEVVILGGHDKVGVFGWKISAGAYSGPYGPGQGPMHAGEMMQTL